MSTDKISPKWLLGVKASVRPFITYIMTILFFYIILRYHEFDKRIVSIVYEINFVILLYWYSEKLLRNAGITGAITNEQNDYLTDKHDPKWINRVKLSVRPLLTYAYIFLFIYVIWKHKDYNITVIKDLGNIVLLIILFWFGERWIRNVGLSNVIKNYLSKQGENTIKNVSKGK